MKSSARSRPQICASHLNIYTELQQSLKVMMKVKKKLSAPGITVYFGKDSGAHHLLMLCTCYATVGRSPELLKDVIELMKLMGCLGSVYFI